MRFVAIPVAEATKEIAAKLHRMLETHAQVVWLVSGGSCVEPQCDILRSLPEEAVRKLTVILADERFGSAGHADSNYEKLVTAGFARVGLRFADILADSLPFSVTVARYSEMLENAFAASDAVFATLGIGQDGHTAGILPSSPAASDTISTAIGYTAADFSRITVGFSTLRRIDDGAVFAYGETKRGALMELHENSHNFSEIPSMVLYDIPSVTIYNDSIMSEEPV